MKKSNASAELDAINKRHDGIIRVDDGMSEQERLVQTFSQALSGEQPLSGNDSGWSVIGSLPLNGSATIRATDGSPLFRLALSAIKGVNLDNDKDACYVILLKRNVEGGIEKLTVDFTRTMPYSVMNENMSKEQSLALAEKFFQKT